MAMQPPMANNIRLGFPFPHLPADVALREALGIVDIVENDVNDRDDRHRPSPFTPRQL